MDHMTELQLADVLSRQSALNDAVAAALQSVALTADRYDAELAEIRDELVTLGQRVDALARAVSAWAGRLS